MIYAPVTILSEDEDGELGTELHKSLTSEQLQKRLLELQEEGWEPIEVQVDESQYSINFYDLH
jgi:hypothetical protein